MSKGLWMLMLASLLAACGLSPDHPKGDGPNTLIIDDPDDLLVQEEESTRMALQVEIDSVADVLDLHGVTVTVRESRADAIGGYGFGGWTPDGFTVNLYVDSTFPEYAELAPERLGYLLVHEMHHARRWRGPGYGGTLFEAMISEGLADHFAVEYLGSKAPPWTAALDSADVARYLAVAEPEFDSHSYDHARWFFGTDPQPPRWTGYTLGYGLVAAYESAHAGTTALGLVDEAARSFRPGDPPKGRTATAR
ncbi:MAG: DUF2268 domain-containing putative Zn-dependent protease [Candidatus Eisenbacteria bacterium]